MKKFIDFIEDRDYKDEYNKFQSSTKMKRYRAELNRYNRKKGTYGNGDGKDASHKNGKIVGYEDENANRGRAEKSRLKVGEDYTHYPTQVDPKKDKSDGWITGDPDQPINISGNGENIKSTLDKANRDVEKERKVKVKPYTEGYVK